MTRFEEQLKQAMARQNAPDGFAARVLAAVADQREQQSRSDWRRWLRWAQGWRIVPVLAALLMMSGGAFYQERQRAERGEAAKAKLLVALRIAGSKLQQAQQRVVEVEAKGAQR